MPPPRYIQPSTDRLCPEIICRQRAEHGIEVDYKDRVEKECYQERLQQQRLARWGYADRAAAVKMTSCEELASRFKQQHTARVY